MSRFISVRALLLTALAALVVPVFPAVAQAASAAPATTLTRAVAASNHGAAPGINPITVKFSGLTYPGTSAGLAACQAKGQMEVQYDSYSIVGYACVLNDPNSGLYNLWYDYRY